MELRRLALRNLRSYTEATIELGPGTTLIAGDVGSGKTSLLYAVEMALFGFAEVDDAAHLVRHLAPDAEVALTLGDGDHEYELRRRFVRRHRKGRDVFEPVENSYRADGARTQYSATELRQRAIGLLGFPDNPNPRSHSDLWRWAVYVPQERMRDVLDQDDEERLETIRKALGVEQYRTAAENAQDVATELRQRAGIRSAEADRLAHWTDDVAVQADREASATRSLEAAQRAEAELRRALADLEARVAEVARVRRQLEADQREADSLALRRKEIERGVNDRGRERARQRAERDRASSELSTATQLAGEEPEHRRLLMLARQAHDRLRTELEAQRANLEELAVVSARTRDLAVQLTEAERRAAAGRAEVDEANHELDRLGGASPAAEPASPAAEDLPALGTRLRAAQTEVERWKAEVAAAERESGEVAQLLRAGVCPRCHQAVTTEGFRRHESEAEAALREARSRLTAAESDRSEVEASRSARERYEREHDRWAEVEKRRSLAAGHRATAQDRSSTAAAAVATIAAERSRLETRVEELRPAAGAAESRQQETRRLEAEVEKLQGAAERAGRAAAQASALEARLRMADEGLARLDAEDARDGATAKDLAARHDVLAGRLQEAATLAETELRLGRESRGRRERLDSAVAEMARSAQLQREAAHRREEAERGAAERAALDRESDHLRELAAWFSGPFREASLRLERQMLGQAHREFERGFTRYFGTLIEDVGLVARLDAHFAPYAEVDGEWTPAAALSGGERTALALAYRLALGGVVRSSGRLKLLTLILDEPTDGFSPEQVARMGELLEELGLPQVVLVSHEAGLSSVADRVIRVTKTGGVSLVVSEAPGEARVPGATTARGPPLPRRPRRVRTPRLDDAPPAP